MGSGMLQYAATLQGVLYYTGTFQLSPHCVAAVGSDILHYTATLHGGSRQWHPSIHCHTAGGAGGCDVLQYTTTLQGAVASFNTVPHCTEGGNGHVVLCSFIIHPSLSIGGSSLECSSLLFFCEAGLVLRSFSFP